MSLPILVGESNPYGGDPAYALYPAPDGCSGHRLAVDILRMRRADYLRSFDRVNLVAGRWDGLAAGFAAAAVRGDRIILLGSRVCSAFGLPFDPFSVLDWPDRRILILPHPSGLCRMWNEGVNRRYARHLVRSLVPEIAHLIGEET